MILLFILFATSCSYASDAVKTSISAFYSQRRIYRGALIWDGATTAIGPSITLYKTARIGGDGLTLFRKLGSHHKISTSFNRFNDNPPNWYPIKLKDGPKDFKHQRRSTYGLALKYSFSYRRYLNVTTEYHRDLHMHKGDYSYSTIGTSLIPFVTVGIGYAIADGKNNRYVYGPEAIKGSAHRNYFVTIFLPFLPLKGRLIFSYKRTLIMKLQNYSADYIRGNDQNDTVTAVTSWTL